MTQSDKVLAPCPSCGTKLAVPSTAAGKKIRCPKCQTIVAITAAMVTPPLEMVAPSASVPQPEISLSDEKTFPGAQQQKKNAPESLGDQATFSGGHAVGDDHFTDEMEIVDLTARYTIEGVLGKGGMGEVQLATDNRLKRKVAIKRVLGDMAKSQTAVRRFMTEAQSIAALNHPNIVQVYDYGRDKDGPFLILEYVDGKSLLDKCYNNPFSVEEAVDLICQVCDGLGKAHDAGIIHRDLKPANVLLTKDGVPKLTDFGLARVETGDTGQTMAGAVLGTLDFMPPEQRRDATQADARSDLWSLAATLYQMVTGKTPKIIKFKDVPQSLQDVLEKALEDEKDNRFQTAREFRDALRQVMDESRATMTDLAEGQCPSCGTKNESNRKFCRKCAVSLEVKCLSCSKGMPIWDEVCGSCGTKQSPLIANRREKLRQRQFQAEAFLQESKYREATQIAEELQHESDPRFQHVKKWSAEFTEGLRREQQQQHQRSSVLHKEAKAHQAAHDYSSAIHALEQIPASLRSPEISALLNQVQGQEERSRSLYEEIRLRVERRELDGLIARVDELLQLVPDREDLRELRDKLEKRDQQQQWARSSAILEANQLIEARKYAECVSLLEGIRSSLRTPEIESLQHHATTKLFRQDTLQNTIDQAVQNNQLNGLLPKVEELLLLKSDATEAEQQLHEQLIAREQKQKSQIKSLLQKAQQLRKEARFDKAKELLVRVPPDLRTDAISASIEELINFSEQRSAVLQRLVVLCDADETREELSRAEQYRELLASADITDVEFESALQGFRLGFEESQRAAKLATQKRQRMIIVVSLVCVAVLIAGAGVVVQRQQRQTAIVDAQRRGDDALQAADYMAAIAAYDDVILLDNKVGEAWLGRAMAKLQMSTPDVTGAWSDLDTSESLAPGASLLHPVRQQAYVLRAIEKANADAIPEALLDLAEAEKLSALPDQISSIKSAIVLAYVRQVDTALAAQQPKDALRQLEEIHRISSHYPRLPELQGKAFLIRARQSLAAGNRGEASADFLTARSLSPGADGLGLFAVILAENLVKRCEETFSDAAFQQATAAVQAVAEMDAGSSALPSLKDRLSNSIATELLGICQQQIAAEDLTGAVASLKSLRALTEVDAMKKDQLMAGLWPEISSLLLKALEGRDPTAGVNAIKTVSTWTTFTPEFIVELRQRLSPLAADLKSGLPEKILPPPTAVAPFDVFLAKAHQQAWADDLGVPVESTNSIGMKLKLIPPGEFIMGSKASFVLSDPNLRYAEQPAHVIQITEPFYMGIHEVTRGQFAAFVNDTGYQTEAEKDGKGGWGCSTLGDFDQKPEYTWKENGMSQTDSHPVVNVSWNDAVEFIKWLSKKEAKHYRLPTEAEWEYCCRAGTGTHFASGDSLASLQGYGNLLDVSFRGKYTVSDNQPGFPFDDGFVFASPVGRFKANNFDLYDMHGNVSEWCIDWYSSDYYAISPLADPGGPEVGTYRVARGGAWSNSAEHCRAASRRNGAPSDRLDYVGFRLALSLSGQ